MPGGEGYRYPAEFVRGIGIAVTVISVGLLVIGVQLLVSCQPILASGIPGCIYPFRWYGVGFLYVSGLAAIGSANLFSNSIQTSETRRAVIERRYFRSVILAVSLGMALFVILLFLLSLKGA